MPVIGQPCRVDHVGSQWVLKNRESHSFNVENEQIDAVGKIWNKYAKKLNWWQEQEHHSNEHENQSLNYNFWRDSQREVLFMQVASRTGSIRWDSDTPTVCENGTAYHGVFRGFSTNNIDAAKQATASTLTCTSLANILLEAIWDLHAVSKEIPGSRCAFTGCCQRSSLMRVEGFLHKCCLNDFSQVSYNNDFQ